MVVEAKGPELAAADVAGMVMGQPRSVIERMLVSQMARTIRMRLALELLRDQPTDVSPLTPNQVRAIARGALSGGES